MMTTNSYFRVLLLHSHQLDIWYSREGRNGRRMALNGVEWKVTYFEKAGVIGILNLATCRTRP